MNQLLVKTFDVGKYFDKIHHFDEKMIGVEFERACFPIVRDILKNYEDFENIEEGPSLRGVTKMSVYTYADARQRFDMLFTEARADKEVLIQSPDGDIFLLQRMTKDSLASSFPKLDIHLSREEITEYIRETREC